MYVKHEIHALWKQYEPLIKAIVELFHPFVEAAVYDLEKGKLVAVYHNISQRQIGEFSPLKELKVNIKDFPAYFTPYYKQNWDGRPLKCTSITIRNENGVPVGLICLNIDTSFFHDGHKLLEAFLKTKSEAENPIEIFGKGEEQATSVIQAYLDEKHLSLNHLNRDQKKEVVQQLYRKGVFNFKNAAPLIAQKLNTSRASVYNHIKQIGNETSEGFMGDKLKNSSQRVQDLLHEHKLDLKVIEFNELTRTAQEAANAIGCEVGQIAKTLIFKGKTTSKPICIIASGKNRVDEKKIVQHVGEEIEKPDAEYVLKHTNFAIGGVPPIGYVLDIPPLIDEDLMVYHEIWAAAGTPNASFRLSPNDLLKITRGRVVSIRK